MFFILKEECHYIILDSSHWKFQYTVDFFFFFERVREHFFFERLREHFFF